MGKWTRRGWRGRERRDKGGVKRRMRKEVDK
jgi:hypothetical protein